MRRPPTLLNQTARRTLTGDPPSGNSRTVFPEGPHWSDNHFSSPPPLSNQNNRILSSKPIPLNDSSRNPVCSSMACTFRRSIFWVPNPSRCQNTGTLLDASSGSVERTISSNAKGPRWSFASGS